MGSVLRETPSNSNDTKGMGVLLRLVFNIGCRAGGQKGGDVVQNEHHFVGALVGGHRLFVSMSV